MQIQTRSILKRTLIYCAVAFFLVILQSTFFSYFKIFSSVPNLLIGYIIAVAVYEDEKVASITGLFSGYLCDAVGSVGVSLKPLLYMLIGYICAIVAIYMLGRNFLSWCIYMLCGYAVSAFFTLFSVLARYNTVNVFDIISKVVFPEFLASILISPLIFLIVKLINLPSQKKII